jgi:hypothetical protein
MSVCHIYLVPLVVLYVFRIRDDKEVKGDEDEAHTVCCDDERSTVLRFSAFVFKRQVSVSCRLPGDTCAFKINHCLFSPNFFQGIRVMNEKYKNIFKEFGISKD